jgi:protein-tyrosine-phosphatase
MKELGVDISGARSKGIEEFAADRFDYVITVCDQRRNPVPSGPGRHAESIGVLKTRQLLRVPRTLGDRSSAAFVMRSSIVSVSSW